MRHSPEDSIVATYYIETSGGELDKVAEDLVVLETTAKWTGQGEPTLLYLESVGEVLEVSPVERGKGYVTLLYPVANMDLEGAAFPCLWLSMIGGPTFALAAYRKSRLVDFRVPPGSGPWRCCGVPTQCACPSTPIAAGARRWAGRPRPRWRSAAGSETTRSIARRVF